MNFFRKKLICLRKDNPQGGGKMGRKKVVAFILGGILGVTLSFLPIKAEEVKGKESQPPQKTENKASNGTQEQKVKKKREIGC